MQQRKTQQKKIIYDALMECDHPTATELYAYIEERYPNVSRATVFRVLQQFAENGEVRKLQLLDSDARFDPRMTPHAHAHCVCCGRVIDIFSDNQDELLKLQHVDGFRVYSTEIEYTGVCAICQQQED